MILQPPSQESVNQESPSIPTGLEGERQFVDMVCEKFNVILSPQMEELLELLRRVHDFYQPHEWPDELKYVADKMNLSSEVVSCFTR